MDSRTDVSVATCQSLLAHWMDDEILEISTPSTGTINTIRILGTPRSTWVLRIYRRLHRERLEREHRITQWARGQGVPVPCPVPTRTGANYAEDDGRFVVLLPFVGDEQIARDDLQPQHVEEAGRFLGSLHRTLEECPIPDIEPVGLSIDRDKTLAGIERLLAVVRSIDGPCDTDRIAEQKLIGRRDWLIGRTDDDVSVLDRFPSQPLHGDYQESNLFFRDGRVSAIIDWDRVYRAPTEWEVARTMDLMLRFDVSLCRTFLAAYRQQASLDMLALDTAMHCYGLLRAYELWLFEEIYEAGNDRPRQFLYPGPFRPLEDRWAELRGQLD